MSSAVIQDFLDMLTAEKGASANTIAAYRSDLMQFFGIIKTDYQQITRKGIVGYLKELNKLCYAQKSQARKLSALREFFKFLMQEKLIFENPCHNISAPKPEKHLPNFLTAEQINILVSRAFKEDKPALKRIGIMIHLMFTTGLRVSELISLTENSINYDKNTILIFGKGSKERIVFISNQAKKNVFEYVKNLRHNFINKNKTSNWLFPSLSSKSGHITRGSFFKHLKQLAYLAELNPDIISPHTLRHSFATNLVNHNADLRSVQKMLGHENISTTEIYTHILHDKLIDTVLKNHPLAEIKNKDN